jgi:four helix bundle protein
MLFQKLEVWQRSVDLSCAVYQAMASAKDWGFKDQITRSALSIPSNIAEGEGRESLKEGIRFLYIARGSAAELLTQIHIGKRINYIKEADANSWTEQVQIIIKQINAFIKSKRERLED